MPESDPQDVSILGKFGFENRRIAEIFAEDADDSLALWPLELQSLPEAFVDVCEIGRTMRFREQETYSVALRFSGDRDAISEVYEMAQRYGGYLQGVLDGAPKALPDAFDLAVERGWNPEMPGFDRLDGATRSGEPVEFRRPYAQLKRETAESSITGAENRAPADEIERGKVGNGPSLPLVSILITTIIVAFGIIWLISGRFEGNGDPSGGDLQELNGAKEDLPLRARHSMAILQDAARYLQGQDEGAPGTQVDSIILADWMSGTAFSNWNPDLQMLVPNLKNLAIDPWGNAYIVRFDTANGGTMARIWSMGPDGLNNDGTADDLAAEPVALAAASGAGRTSKVIDLLSPSVKGEESAVGDWTKEGTIPVSPEKGEYAVRPFTVPVPDSFEVKFTIERRSGDYAFVVGYPARGKRVTSLVDLPLQKGREIQRGVGISQIVESAGAGGAQLLPKGERKEVYVRVDSGAITTGIREGENFSWRRGDDELASFPKTYVDQAGEASLFIGTWNSSFAIHGAELVDLGASDAAPTKRSPIVLPSDSEYPRHGVIALGWSDLGELVKIATEVGRADESGLERSRLIAVTLELDDSEGMPSDGDLANTQLTEGRPMPGSDRIEYFQIGSFSIRVGGTVGPAVGVVRSSSPAMADKDLEVLGLGDPLNFSNDEDKSTWQVYRTGALMIIHAEPMDRSGRSKITLWSEFPASEGIHPVHVKFMDNEWMRVPDRSIIPSEFPERPEKH